MRGIMKLLIVVVLQLAALLANAATSRIEASRILQVLGDASLKGAKTETERGMTIHTCRKGACISYKPTPTTSKEIRETPFHWNSSLNELEHLYESIAGGGSCRKDFVEECCPSVTEIYQPLGGVSKDGRILELYRDQNLTQSFYQTSCKDGVKGRPCKYIDEHRYRSFCVQQYSYTYALVRELDSIGPSRLDYIRIRSGCSCEILKNPRY